MGRHTLFSIDWRGNGTIGALYGAGLVDDRALGRRRSW